MKKTSFGTLIYYLKKESKLLILFLSVRLAMTAIDVYSPLLIKNLIDDALPSKNINLLLSLIIIGNYVFDLGLF